MRLDYNFENGVIGSLLIDPLPVLPIIRRKLSAGDFCDKNNRLIFQAACSLADEGKAVDVLTILEAAELNEEGGRYAAELMQLTPTAANVETYIEGVLKRAQKDRLRQLCDELAELLLLPGSSTDALCTFMQRGLGDISESNTPSNSVGGEALENYYSLLRDIDLGLVAPFIKSGYSELDEILGGFAREGLYILAARPGMGKTTLGLQIADRVAKRGLSTLFVSLEMSQEQISAKRVAVLSGLPYRKLACAALDAGEYEKVCRACDILSKRPLRLNKKRSCTLEDIELTARQIPELAFLVIDYLGLIQNSRGSSLYEKMSDTSGGLKRLAMSLGIPILCLAQLNREVENRCGNEPKLSDLRDSGAIEQDADGVILLLGLTEKEKLSGCGDIDCIVAKNRHGATGRAKLRWFLDSGRIVGKDGAPV